MRPADVAFVISAVALVVALGALAVFPPSDICPVRIEVAGMLLAGCQH